jgi:hypothetical protein
MLWATKSYSDGMQCNSMMRSLLNLSVKADIREDSFLCGMNVGNGR